MSFIQSGREKQRFIKANYRTPKFEMIDAILRAREMNTIVIDEAGDPAFEFAAGKLRELKISFYPIQCDVMDDSRATTMCVTGEITAPKQERFAITEFTKTKAQRLMIQDVRLVDNEWGFSEHAMQQIASIMGAADKALSIQLTQKVVAHKGLHLDGSEYGNRITMSQTTNGLLTPAGYWQIEKEQTDGAFMNTFTVGSTEVFNWRKAYGIAATNTTLGQDFTKVGIPNLVYDINLNSIMGVDAGENEFILTFDPQALKFVSWSRNAGMFATDLKGPGDFDAAFKSGGRDVIKGYFYSPNYNFVWDFYAKFNPCAEGSGTDGAWDWWLQLEWDIVFPSIQVCNIQGVNGIMMYKTCPVVIPDCPTGTTPSPAAVARNFNWVPSASIFTPALLIGDMTIGGNNTQPNVLIHNIAELVAAMNENYLGQATFTVAGAAVRYNGYSAITGGINNGAIAITFA